MDSYKAFNSNPAAVKSRTSNQGSVERKEDDDDEKRSITTELDYKFKGAARHIVQDKSSKKQQLREKILYNLDKIRLGTRGAPSEASTKSLPSIATRATAVN